MCFDCLNFTNFIKFEVQNPFFEVQNSFFELHLALSSSYQITLQTFSSRLPQIDEAQTR
eukprot:m.172568 g.172568  ORF g.172568 m.172568 type:complete len:59 (-) comp15374_c1_seq2:1432-1608(-)